MVSQTSIFKSSYVTLWGIKNTFEAKTSNEQHQFDLFYVPHNFFEGDTCKYTLTVADAVSRCQVARGLKTREASEVCIYLRRNI